MNQVLPQFISAEPVVPANPGDFTIEDLTVRYGVHTALSNITFDIRQGAITAIVGPSGCGKTTFLHCLNRLIDLTTGAAVDGTVRLDGEDIFAPGYEVAALRRKVGLIFQRPNPFPLSIAENIELGLREHRLGTAAQRREKTEQVLHDVGLFEEVKDRLEKPAQSLSGGQQQRLCLARALALDPEVLLMDEPCSALDPIAATVIEDLIKRMRGQLTIVIVTHNLAQARRVADDLAVFWVRDGAGTLIENGPAETVFKHPLDPQTAAYIQGRVG